MKKIFLLLLPLLLFGSAAYSQMRNISSEVINPLDKKIKAFMVLDTEFGFVLGRQPVPVGTDGSGPQLYFVQDKLSLNQRLMSVYSFEPGGDYEWLLEDNAAENDLFFARSRFVTDKNRTKWKILVEGSTVIFQNAASNAFLAIAEDGDIFPVEDRAEASRWKLIRLLE
ncbi:MAG: hypothetical protein K8F24_08520 [Bacteroidales bacterium]|nr:hypothetical protein [Bacteroidales bacterium]